MERKSKLAFSALIVLGILALPVLADFVQTLVVFSVDVTISFTVFTLGGGGNQTNSKTALPGNFTEAYFFNTSLNFAELVAPCAGADGTNCQSGGGVPAYRIRNTGNSNITITMNLSVDPPSGIKLCANSSKPTGCPQTVVALCDLSGTEGNLNNSAWLNISANIGQNSPCFETNVTLYANFTNVATATSGSSTITLNSTKS